MQFSEAVKLALQSLWGNKLRSILTLIGVVMGVASVIMVITLTNTANAYFGTQAVGLRRGCLHRRSRGADFQLLNQYFKYQKRKIIRSLRITKRIKEGCSCLRRKWALCCRRTTNVVLRHTIEH